MFNSHIPSENDLPTSSQLLKSTIIAFVLAGVLLLLVILPAEYGYDPTGVGEILGLKKMGEIKVSLEKEELNEPEVLKEMPTEIIQETSKTVEENQDIMEVQIAPGEAIEIKLEMKKGSVAKYKWSTNNGALNFNLHGDGYKGMHISTTYKKGRMVNSDSGELIAEFDGYHGWFWRNRNDVAVKVILEANGNFIQIKQMK
jgi:septum formation topological specificity factor MinE